MHTAMVDASAPAWSEPFGAQPHPRRVLIVEDSSAARQLLSAFLRKLDGVLVDAVASRAEAESLLRATSSSYLCAVLDLGLPDAPNGEIVDVVRAHGIPMIVLSGTGSDTMRRTLAAKGVVDYVLKQHASELRHVVDVVRRLRDNPRYKVLVVDDSAVFREHVADLLRKLSYQTLCAGHGREALDLWSEHPDLSLVITDVHMPVMDGFELIAALRQRTTRQELPIIGLSDRTRGDISARLLKAGANDFLSKPFEIEEFQCRIAQNLDLLSYIRLLKSSAHRDALTGLSNRRHLFERSNAMFLAADGIDTPVGVVLVDVDHFKRVNDQYGHPAGDDALKVVAQRLARWALPGDCVARYGGEEFVCLTYGRDEAALGAAVERLRADVEATEFDVAGIPVPLRISAGFALGKDTTFDALLAAADRALYNAKNAGRNRVCMAVADGLQTVSVS